MAARERNVAEIARLEAPERMGRMPPQEVLELLDPHPGIRCLDLGAGTGYMSRPLASHLAPGGVVGLDRSQGMLEELGRRAREETGAWVARVQADAGALPFDEGAFGRVLSLNLHHELDDPTAVLEEVHRVLGPGGLVLVVDWEPGESPGGPPQEGRWAAGEHAEALREAGFEDVEANGGFPYHAAVTGVRPSPD